MHHASIHGTQSPGKTQMKPQSSAQFRSSIAAGDGVAGEAADTRQTTPPVPASALDLIPPDTFPQSRVRQARRDLIERIVVFVLRHDLEVTGPNLAIICNALSGSHGPLARAFVAREIADDPIDQRWLDTLVRLDPETGERMEELEQLMDQLEYALMRFSQTAKTAHDESSEHRGTLDAQIAIMSESAKDNAGGDAGAGDAIERVIALSRAMRERIEHVEAAMGNSQAESEQLREHLAKARLEADVDHLTRLPNRRAFERTLISAAQRAQSRGDSLSVAFCDIDRFKAINDTYGHDAGDRVLVAIAATFSLHAGSGCFVARHGGEEFVMLFYKQDRDAAWRKLEGIRRAQAGKALVDRKTGKGFGKVTFSGGIAEVNGIDDTRAALARADAALYEAKRGGRDRIVAH